MRLLRWHDCRRTDKQWPAGMKGDALKFLLRGRMHETTIPDRPQSAWQHMPEITGGEFSTAEGFHPLGIAVGAVLVKEGDVGVGHREDARIGDRGAADISAEIFDDIFPAAEWLQVDAPVFLPDGGVDGGEFDFGGFPHFGDAVTQARPEHGAQGGLGDQEVGVFDGDDPPGGIESRAGHDAVNVRMKLQPLVPSVQHHHKPAGGRAERLRIGQKVGQRGGRGVEKALIDLLGRRGEEQRAEFGGQGEVDHEVGRADALAELAFDPGGGGAFAALRAGPVVAGMVMKFALPARATDMQMPAHFRSAAMGDGPDGAALCVAHGAFELTHMSGQEAQQRVDYGGGHDVRELAWKSGAEALDQRAAILLAAVREVEIDHGGVDVAVAEQGLDGVQAGPRLDQVGGEGMTQGVHRADGQVERLARLDHQALERADGHGTHRLAHPAGDVPGRATSAPDIGKKQKRMAVEFPIAAQVLDHCLGNGHHAAFVALALADPQFAVRRVDIVDGQREALRKAQAATVNELEGNAVAAQPDVPEQADDIRTGQHDRLGFLVLGADLGEDFPRLAFQHADKEELGRSGGQAEGFRLPAFDGLNVQDVVAQLGLGDGGRIAPTELVHEPHLAVIRVAGARCVELECEELGQSPHRGIGVRLVIERIALGTACERTIPERQLLVAGLVGTLRRRFGLALAAVRD